MASQYPHGEVDDEAAPHDGVLVLQDERHHRRQERIDHLRCEGKINHCVTLSEISIGSFTQLYTSSFRFEYNTDIG